MYFSLPIKKVSFTFLLCLFLTAKELLAGPNVFEVGSDTIHDTFINNTYDTFSFQTPFASTPAVFAIGSTAGNNSCEVRFQNIGTTSFEAVCAEDSSWDGQHVAVPLQYMALAEGVQRIPTNNGGSVVFEVGCVETAAVQHNCTTGCPTESYEPISFSAGFTGSPVVIANIQTTNNPQLGPAPVNPIQPMMSVAVDGISSAGFDLAIDLNKEDNVGRLRDEKICWLAVEETTNCDLSGTDNTLDFSGIGGPSSVAFEALITPENVDGWDNGCNAGEGAAFTNGCFTSTPVAIATKRSRNEEEGWLRYCALNSGEFRFTIDEQRVTGQNRQHVDETASVVAFGAAFTTPVSLAYFQANQKGKRALTFEWETESESFNVGFNLWAMIDGEWEQINRNLLAARQGDFSQAQTYKKVIKLSKDKRQRIEAVGLSSVDNSGYEEFYGPFSVGQFYGEQANIEAIEWASVRAEYEARMADAGFIKLHSGRWVKANKKNLRKQQRRAYQQGKRRAVVELTLPDGGVHKVSGADILEHAPELVDTPLKALALTHRGDAVARLIESDDEVFSADDEIIFFANELNSTTALYTQERVYRLHRDRQKAIDAGYINNLNNRPNDVSNIANTGLQQTWLGANAHYFVASTSGDPWYDAMLLSTGSPVAKQYAFENINPQANEPAVLHVNLSGGIELPGAVDDHHVQVKLNGNVVLEQRFDGFSDVKIAHSIAANLLIAGRNIVEIEVVGDTGKFADIVYIDQVGLSVPVELEHSAGEALSLVAEPNKPFYRVASERDDVTVYAHQGTGNFTRLASHYNNNTDANTSADVSADADDGGYVGQVVFGGIDSSHLDQETHYSLIDDASYAAPSHIQRVNTQNLLAKFDANYVIVAHPAFIGQDLQQFAEFKREQGHNIRIVSWLDIVNGYGFGVAEPIALRNYLKAASQKSDIEYVLLIGGHSYDYNDYLGNGNVSFIPTQYEAVSRHFQYAPTDNHYADLDDDGLPDLALGRWPVRDAADLTTIINKTLAWEDKHQQYSHRLMLVADATDQGRGQRFVTQIDSMMEQLGVDRSSLDVNEVYLDEYLARDLPIQEAKNDFLSSYQAGSQGIGLTVFNGHASSSRWTYRNLLNAGDVSQLQNVDKPTTIMPLACYTTYYETPAVNSLAHQFLFENQGGAALIVGAAYLSEDRENSIFGVNMLKKMKQGKSWGQAMREVKSSMAPWNDAVTNWTILGDPSLRLGQPDAK